MSVTLSPPVRVAALVGAIVLTGLAAFLFLLGRGLVGGEPATVATPAPVPVTTPAKTPVGAKPTPKPTAPPKKPRVESGFPAKVDNALRNNRVVVVAVTVPGGGVDSLVRQEARAGAKASRAGFVALSASNVRALSTLVSKTGVLPAPAVVVVKRPGVVVSTFSVTDAGTIAQAVAQARR